MNIINMCLKIQHPRSHYAYPSTLRRISGDRKYTDGQPFLFKYNPLFDCFPVYSSPKGLLRQKATTAPLHSKTLYFQWHHGSFALRLAKRCTTLARSPMHPCPVTYARIANRNEAASQHGKKTKWRIS